MNNPIMNNFRFGRMQRSDVQGCLWALFFWPLVILVFFVVILALSGCERRELYVYGDEFHSVTLDVDWREYSSTDPDGMTVWFYPLDDPSHAPYRTTTASVRHQDIYLPGGRYQGLVIDYSPEEYSRQEFLGMDHLETARVQATPATYQPDSLTIVGEGVPATVTPEVNANLYGDVAWTDLHTSRWPVREEGGLYIVASQPEPMGTDTLLDKTIDNGLYGDYIPWKERNTYQSTLVVTQLFSQPHTVIWKLRIRVWIHSGFNYLWQQPASISGLADGHLLPLNQNTDQPCLMAIDGWELQRTGENSGWLSTTVSTFGLRPASILPDAERHGGTRAPGDTEPDYRDPDWYAYRTGLCLPEELRLNLSFVLRDHATTLHYHFDVGDCVVSYDEQLVLRIELGADYFKPDNPDGPDPIDLPYVDTYDGTGFGAEVTPWQEEDPIDVPM